jgi:hypothetical protein
MQTINSIIVIFLASSSSLLGPFFGGNLRSDRSRTGDGDLLSNMRYVTSVIVYDLHAVGGIALCYRKGLKLAAYVEYVFCMPQCCIYIVTDQFDMIAVACQSFWRLARNLKTRVFAMEQSTSLWTILSLLTMCACRLPMGTCLYYTYTLLMRFFSILTMNSMCRLVENMTFRVDPGTNLLLTGPNGQSSLITTYRYMAIIIVILQVLERAAYSGSLEGCGMSRKVPSPNRARTTASFKTCSTCLRNHTMCWDRSVIRHVMMWSRVNCRE